MNRLLLALVLVATAAGAQRPPIRSASELPLAVRRAILTATSTCREAGGTPGRSPDLVKYADLTGDGLGDYVVDWHAYDCGGAVSAMENGQNGATVEVLVAGPGSTAASVYTASVYGATIETVAGKAKLWVDVAAASCGQRAQNVPFANWKFCSRALVWNATTRKFAFAPLAQMRAVQ